MKNLQDKMWYRFLLVAKIGAYLVFGSFVLFYSLAYKPSTSVDYFTANLTCNNGEIYTVKPKDPVFAERELTSKETAQFTGLCSLQGHFNFNKANEEGISNDQIWNYLALQSTRSAGINYSFTNPTHQYGSWGEMIKWLFIGWFILWIVIEVIWFALMYVLVGSHNNENK